MSLCLAGTAVALSVAASAFTLRWTHSVEKTEWQERWRVEGDVLVLEEARVRGSGAGMEPADGARWQDGWWAWRGSLPAQAALRLAVSGATGRGWQWCADGLGCRDLEAWLSRQGRPPLAIEIRPSARCAPLGPLPRQAFTP
jgi:hypothetical protein